MSGAKRFQVNCTDLGDWKKSNRVREQDRIVVLAADHEKVEAELAEAKAEVARLTAAFANADVLIQRMLKNASSQLAQN
ncbi:hypothetical protein [Pseudomonas putida]|uniref:Uncharacterized protein n=1 Tax=Pseudomonas putida TaxID=303 RepID=A0A8I1ECH1_PSEPU|nr:hypothetical protein [Pseudomonas putida]MBI6882754.1 hypothetical protein [Pseudomonas putida]